MKIKSHNWKLFFVKIVLPTILAITLFTISFFVILIPSLEDNLLDQKREMIRELTHTAWSIIADYAEKEKAGTLTRSEAQTKALTRISKIRYGHKNKDYFWISDIDSQMVMHPYRPDLNGTDVSDYADRHGKKIFVEFSNIVKNNPRTKDGFLKYMWQWEDNADLIVAKLSYVKGYSDWGWIVGTGIYIEDVKEEIAKLTSKIISTSLAIITILFIILLHILWQTISIEKMRFLAENNTIESKEKYKALVEAATDGFIMIVDKIEVLSNQTMQEMLGYSERELSNLTIYDLIQHNHNENIPSINNIKNLMENKPAPDQFEATLLKNNGETIDVLLTSSLINFSSKNGFILIAREIKENHQLSEKRGEEGRDALILELKSTLHFFNQNVGKYADNKIITSDITNSISDVAKLMTNNQVGAVFISSPLKLDQDIYIGIVTDNDIRNRAVSKGLDLNQPVVEIMSAPIITISENAPIFEAAILMQEKNIRHIALNNSKGEIQSIITNSELIQIDGYSAVSLITSIKNAESVESIKRLKERLPLLVTAILNSGGNAKSITRIISTVTETITSKIINLAIDKHGNSPTSFAFINLGTGGRQEQTLNTNQNNAIIYELLPEADSTDIQNYFNGFTKQICSDLELVGLQLSTNNRTCCHAEYCLPIDKWQSRYSHWINNWQQNDNIQQYNTNVLYDFHCVYGNKKLSDQLRRHIFTELNNTPSYITNIANQALEYKPHLSLFGNIITETSGEHSETFNINLTMRTIVDFARTYAIKNGVSECNTFDRLRVLSQDKDVLSNKEYSEIIIIYNYLMELRLIHQSIAAKRNQPINDNINPKRLSQVEQQTLKNIFSQIHSFQNRLASDFKGAAIK